VAATRRPIVARSSPKLGTGSSWAGPLRGALRLGTLLLVAGALLTGCWLVPLGTALWRQHSEAVTWSQLARPGRPPAGGAAPPPSALTRPVGGMDFRLTIPRLGYSAVVHEGVGLDVLAAAPGRYPRTSWPGQPGNVGVAAHNVFWIRFDQLRAGDEIDVDTRYGSFRYLVSGTEVVPPSDGSVLDPAPNRQLTLTTCWPLWAGQFATRRLVVFATAAGS
jgi:sortase A